MGCLKRGLVIFDLVQWLSEIPISISDLSRKTKVTKVSIYFTLKIMKEKGLIQEVIKKHKKLILTEKGLLFKHNCLQIMEYFKEE